MDKKKIYMIAGILLLIISIAGSAYSYYSLVGVNKDSVYGTASGSANMNLKVEKISSGATGSLIPVDNDTTTLTKAAVGEANTNFEDNKRCIDKNGYAACQIYKVTLTNKSSIDLVVSGGVSLSGDNTPNIECAIMNDINTVADNTSCRGTKTLANNYTIKANESKVYYIMVYVKNLNKVQTDTGEFTGTIFFNADNGDKLKANFEPNKETIAEYITNLYTNADKSTIVGNNITYNYASSVALMNDRLGGTTTDLDGGNIRYYGESPNNYIYFNCSDYNNQTSDTCELWRIIGVFDGKVKIMRNESIGTYPWASNSQNEWTKSSLMKLLNPGYETESVGGSLYYNSSSGTCYKNGSTTVSCDFTSVGIKNKDTRDKIAEVTWNLGECDDFSDLDKAYKCEREPATSSSKSTTWTGKVALVYLSDYKYISYLHLCNNSTCISTNWMKPILGTNNWGWLLTPYSSYSGSAFAVDSTGYIITTYDDDLIDVGSAHDIVPTLYLSSEQVIGPGDGSISNPYKLNND